MVLRIVHQHEMRVGIAESTGGKGSVTVDHLVRVPIPPLTEERRKEISKIASRYLEEAKVAVRNVRRHGLDELKKFEKDSKVSQDESKKITPTTAALRARCLGESTCRGTEIIKRIVLKV